LAGWMTGLEARAVGLPATKGRPAWFVNQGRLHAMSTLQGMLTP
jgi:hypothetical protein